MPGGHGGRPRATGTQIVHIHCHEHVPAAIGYPPLTG